MGLIDGKVALVAGAQRLERPTENNVRRSLEPLDRPLGVTWLDPWRRVGCGRVPVLGRRRVHGRRRTADGRGQRHQANRGCVRGCISRQSGDVSPPSVTGHRCGRTRHKVRARRYDFRLAVMRAGRIANTARRCYCVTSCSAVRSGEPRLSSCVWLSIRETRVNEAGAWQRANVLGMDVARQDQPSKGAAAGRRGTDR